MIPNACSHADLLVIHRICLQHPVQRLLAGAFRLLVEYMGWVRPVQVSGNLVVLLPILYRQ